MSLLADLNFVDPNASTTPAIHYSGGDTPQHYNEAYGFVPTEIHDGRGTKSVLDKQGFQLVPHEVDPTLFDDEQRITSEYYRQVEALVSAVTGATATYAFDHTIRRGVSRSTRRPAHHVHNDYTDASGMLRAREVVPAAFEAHAGKRMIQINVWRSIAGVVERSPLAFLDATTLHVDDLRVAAIHFPDSDHIGQIYAVCRNPNHRWVYFPGMKVSEAVLIKSYDTLRDGRARFTPHTAFELPQQPPQAPPRQSIETRTFAFFG